MRVGVEEPPQGRPGIIEEAVRHIVGAHRIGADPHILLTHCARIEADEKGNMTRR
jgi:hypothetical protein